MVCDLPFLRAGAGVMLRGRPPAATDVRSLPFERRLQDWLVERARFGVAVAAGVVSIFFLEIFARIDTQVPFVYFQF